MKHALFFIAVAVPLVVLGVVLVGTDDAQACHGDCSPWSNGCAQWCTEGGMAGWGYCVDSSPANGYRTSWGQGKRDGNTNCGGPGNCIQRNCFLDFECNAGYDKVGGGGAPGNVPNGYCQLSAPPCTPGACTSAPNVCGNTNGTRICPSGLCATPNPNTCPPPTCSASPGQAPVGQNVTATGTGAFGSYGWNSGGGSPATANGNPAQFIYGTVGTKTITVTDSATTRTNICTVGVCVANFGQACQSAPPNACGMVGTGTIQCNGSCDAVTPPASACPPPTCAIAPASAQTGQTVTATGSGGIAPYSWSGGGNPAGGSGPTFNTLYATNGTKTVTVTDSNLPAKSGICTVNIGYAFVTTGSVTVAEGLDFDTDYDIRVKVWDADDRESAWSPLFSYSTKPGPWPDVDFTYAPSKPAANQSIQFTDATANDPIAWSWLFGDGGTSTDQNPAYAFSAEGTYTVTLEATNDNGTCSASKAVGVTKPIPTYREVRPGQQPPPTGEQSPTGGGLNRP